MNEKQHGNNAEHFDVVIVGAGISGIAAAYELAQQCPDQSFVVLEAQASFGGTWWVHRYPGARSDSDLYTYGYRFKPWTRPPIATGEEIQGYLGEVIQDGGLEPHIRYRHVVRSASWSSATNTWTLEVARGSDNTTMRVTCNFLWMCQGYYKHDKGYTPHWPNMEAFKGRFVHPQTWPEDLDCTGRRVVVIGSGATAATLIPAMAGKCSELTMLQRSPTYFTVGRNAVPLADELRELNVDENWIHEIVRRKMSRDREVLTGRARQEPEQFKQDLLNGIKAQLGEDFDVDTHFNPRYRPWTQRIAFDPDGRLFRAFREGKASVVTDEIERFTESGIELVSGKTLEADIIVTATGFHLSVMGGIPFDVDGAPVDFAKTVAYRGMAFTGVPNMVWVFGYFRASWTLRVHLINDFVCGLLQHMKQTGAKRFEPVLRPEDEAMPLKPWMDSDDFNPGYLTRSLHLMPKLGTKPEWRISQDYMVEKEEFEAIDFTDPVFAYARE